MNGNQSRKLRPSGVNENNSKTEFTRRRNQRRFGYSVINTIVE